MASSVYCLVPIHRCLTEDGLLSITPEDERRRARAVADILDRLRISIGPISMSVNELIEEGRRR
jgi:hypothetical protein